MRRKFTFLVMLLTLLCGVKFSANAQDGQYRIKSNSTGKYLTIFDYTNCNNSGTHGGVGVADYMEDNDQIFTFEVNSSGYYVKSADGYYIKCYDWNVDAYSTTSPTFNATTLLGFNFNGETFTLRKLGSSKYFKVENNYVFCDCDGTNGTIENWVLEPVVTEDDVIPGAPTDLTATEVTHNSVTLSWTAGTDALKYNVYRNGSLLAENIGATTYKDETVQPLTTYNYTVESIRFSNVSSTHSNEVSVTTLEMPAIQDIIVGDGLGTSKFVPVYTYYNYSYSQQIFTKSQLGFEAGNISKIAFFKTNSGYNHNRKLKIYMVNTDKESFSGTADWVAVAESDLVYDSRESGYTFSADNDWCEIQLDNVFEYQGGNILIYIQDNTGSYKTAPTFKTNDATGSAIMVYSDGQLLQDNNLPKTSGTANGNTIYPRTDTNNQIKFTVEFKPQVPTVNVNTENIAFETPIRGGSYWTERAGVQPIGVVITPKGGAEVTNIELVDNSFFSIPADIDFTANPITFNVSTGVSNEEGTKTATLRITHTAEGETIGIPVTAEVYMAAQGDAIENPFVVEFTENSYSNTVDFTTLYDDYTIYGEAGPTWQEGNNPDAVYKFTLSENALVNATVTTGSWMAVYNENFSEQGGPKADNHICTDLTNAFLPAGTYYIVIAVNNSFDFTITKTTVPAPVVSYSNPDNGAVNQDNPMLEWSMNYADEYQVLLGTTNPPTDVVVGWTSELATSYQTENLQNNTQYFWQVNAKNEAGTTNGDVCSFVTLLDVPAITSATAVNLYPGEATTITWTEVEGASEYNVYVNGEKVATTAETSYELSGLAYNMTGYNVTVSATHALGESLQSEAIIVKVAGEFPLVVSVIDANGNHIEGATVTIDMTKAYDEFKNQVAAVEAMTTNADGTATVTLPVLGVYDQYGSSWVSPYYKINVSKYPYVENSSNLSYNNISNGDTYTSEHTLFLPTIASVSFDNEQVIRVGSDIVLKWSNYGVEGATAYNVYKKPYVGDETLVETVTTNELTITAEYDNVGSKYGVSAVFGDVETSIKYTTSYVYVLGNGSFYGYVTDGTSPISGITVELSGTNAIGEDVVTLITDESGYFEGEILEGNDYTLSISHYDYEEVVMPNNIDIIYGENDLGTFTLTAKPSAEGIAVTAIDNGEYANVTWTGSYEKYNVYIRNMDNPQKVEFLGEVAASSYTDNEWADLDNGTYQYGVSAFTVSEGGYGNVIEEGFEHDGNWPDGWTSASFWSMSGTRHSGSYALGSPYASSMVRGTTYKIAMPNKINTANAKLSFYYLNKWYQNYPSDLYVYYSENPDGPWENVLFNTSSTHASWTYSGEIDLDAIEGMPEQIYIAFGHAYDYGDGVWVDDIVVTGIQSVESESQIVWSNNLKKQGPATFEGGYSENPTAWNVAANWSTGEVPADGADVIIKANAVISTNVNVANLTINGTYNDANLTIANGGALTVTGDIVQTNYQLILEEGGQIFQNNANVTARFRMIIDNPTDWSNAANKDGWQFISMPLTGVEYISFATKYNPSTGQNTCDYDLYKYDGSQDKEWQNYKDGGFYYGTDPETTFKSGTGYLASRKKVETVTVSGTLNTDIPYAFQNYAQSFYDENKDLANFRLFGNPFTYDIHFSDFNAQSIVNGYAVVGKDGNYVYRTTEPIKVGEGFFIQATNWTQFIYQPDSKDAKRESYNSLNVIASGKAGNDNLVINLGGYSEGFTKLQNFNENISEVFVANNGKRYGIANVDANVSEIELFFDAKEMGNYSISIEPNGKFQSVTLVDRMTGIETNMLMEDYNFTATANDNPNRFVIRLANGQEPTANSNFVYQSGEELIVDAEGTIQIIDVMGRMVYSNDVESSNNRINVSNLKGATYIVRNISNNTVRTQKIVIL